MCGKDKGAEGSCATLPKGVCTVSRRETYNHNFSTKIASCVGVTGTGASSQKLKNRRVWLPKKHGPILRITLVPHGLRIRNALCLG